ncbi:MAG: arylesterase [Deltaproteobacteria bacterium]|nr:arylesterase [Deltaproteobacteria bacterium]
MSLKQMLSLFAPSLALVLALGPSDAPGAAADRKSKVILFLGDSLTAGYGVSLDQAFPSLIQQRIDAKGWNFKVVNAGQSGDTTAGGLGRIDWLLRQPIDILVLELGANDGLRGLPVEAAKNNLQAIIDKARKRYPSVKVVLMGMRLPPNLGKDYAAAFNSIFPELASKKKTVLVPFLLEGIGGVPRLNLPDGIHPTAEGHRMIAANVWRVLEPVLRSML